MAERKTRYDKVLSKLPDTLEWSAGQDISSATDFLLKNDGLPGCFLDPVVDIAAIFHDVIEETEF